MLIKYFQNLYNVIHFMKSKALNSRLFTHKMSSELLITKNLFHIKVRSCINYTNLIKKQEFFNWDLIKCIGTLF